MIALHYAMFIIPKLQLEFCRQGKNKQGYYLTEVYFKKGVLDKLRCPHCGRKVKLYKERYKRHFIDLKNNRFILFILPMVECTNPTCPHYLSSIEQKKFKNYATHVVLPSFMTPYLRYDVNIINDLALAQEELNRLGFKGKCIGEEFEKVTLQSSLFRRLKRRYKELWLYLLTFLNTKQSRCYLAYLKRFRAQLQVVYTQTCLNHFYNNSKRIVNGWVRHGEYYCKQITHRLSWMLRLVLSEFCPQNGEYPIYPPWDFWTKVRPYRES